MMDKEYVWYASYGSNLCEERFLCYIKGGKPEGSLDTEPGCRDQSLPLKNQPVHIHHQLYFAKEAMRWGNGGVAFIGKPSEEQHEYTLGRMYLITKEQFIDVVSQENRNIEVNIDLLKVKEEGNLLFHSSWYGNVVYLGEKDGYPIYTFTVNWDDLENTYRTPSKEYLGTIIRGILQTYIIDDEKLLNYLLHKDGVELGYNRDELQALIQICKEKNSAKYE
jgi:hypothetical protein